MYFYKWTIFFYIKTLLLCRLRNLPIFVNINSDFDLIFIECIYAPYELLARLTLKKSNDTPYRLENNYLHRAFNVSPWRST